MKIDFLGASSFFDPSSRSFVNSPNYKSNSNAQFSTFLLDLFFIIPLIMQLNLAEEEKQKVFSALFRNPRSFGHLLLGRIPP